MGKRKWGALVLVAALLVFGAGVAVGKVSDEFWPTSSGNWGFFDGNKLQDFSSSVQSGYVAGVFDALSAIVKEHSDITKGYIDWNPLSSTAPKPFDRAASDVMVKLVAFRLDYESAADNPTLGQLKDIVAAYLRNHPEERQNSAALLVWRALAQAEWK